MSPQRLLQRIRQLENHPRSRFDEPTAESDVASVREHLQQLLNTRQGSAEIDIAFGMPEISHIGGGALSAAVLANLESELQQVIGRYETRLAGVSVHALPMPDGAQALRFEISGTLAGGEHPTPAVFTAMVEAGGKVRLTG